MNKLLTTNWLSLLIIHFTLFVPAPLQAQKLPTPTLPTGKFLVDTIEIGRPFRYSLVYHHAPAVDVLFPDTARHFDPYFVKDVAVFTTQTNGVGANAVSRDSAVYTLLSFNVDSVQLLQVPIRLINPTDCTTLLTNIDTVFLQSKLTASVPPGLSGPDSFSLATATTITQLRQQFNYPVLVGVIGTLLGLTLLVYALFGRIIRRQWRLYRLRQRHHRFLREYGQLTLGIHADAATDTANQAIVAWKLYLERLDRQPYASLTTSEIAERMNDERVTLALREADRMIYGGGFSEQSQRALQTLSEVATKTYHRRREAVRASPNKQAEVSLPAEETETSALPD